MSSFSAEAYNTTNGVGARYFVSFFSSIRINSGDVLVINFPVETFLIPESGKSLKCTALNGMTSVSCSKDTDTKLVATLNGVNQLTGLFKFSIESVRNPPSLKESSKFGEIYIATPSTDSIPDAKVCEYT